MVGSGRPGVRHRWLFPLLAALLVLGHACELPAYAELVGHRHTDTAHETGPGGHHHGEADALTCDGALVIRNPAPAESSPGWVMPVVAPALDIVVVPPGPDVAARPIRSSAGPPLFLLFSSLLI